VVAFEVEWEAGRALDRYACCFWELETLGKRLEREVGVA